jgi:amino acid permease
MIEPDELTIPSIGGTIGTALYVQIGRGLLNGGPASLFIAFTLWCSVILAVTLCMAEMVTYLPISSPFIRFAGRYADEAFGFAAGWNFFIFEAILVPFEMTACNVVIHFWSDAVPTGAVIAIVMVSVRFLISFRRNHSTDNRPLPGTLRCHQSDGSQVVWRDRVLGCSRQDAADHRPHYLHFRRHAG